MTAAQLAQQSNRTSDGKYTTKSHSEADIDLGTDHPPVPRIDSQGNDWGPAFSQYQRQSLRQHDIMYVHYDDAFSDDFVDAELSGDLNRIDAVREAEEHWEWENDAYTSEAEYAVEQLGLDVDEARDEQLFDELRSAIAESDSVIQPYDSVRENTPDKLMRMEIFEGESLTDENGEAYSEPDAQVEVLQAKFKQLGLDPADDDNAAAIEELVNNGPHFWHEGVALDVIWSGKYTDAVPDQQEKSLEFTDPNLLLIDSFNGSGWEVRAKGKITRTIGTRGEQELPKDKRAFLDHRAGGYGWQSIAGVVQSAYDAEPVVTEQPENASGNTAST